MIGAAMTQSLADFCPGILHAVPAKDGLLMRLRLPAASCRPRRSPRSPIWPCTMRTAGST